MKYNYDKMKLMEAFKNELTEYKTGNHSITIW